MITPTHLDPALIARNTHPDGWENTLVHAYLQSRARTNPDKIAIIDGACSLTYGALDSMVARAAAGLRERGIGRGDVVAWQLPNWFEAFVVHHAALRIHAISNPIIPIYRDREVAFILRQSRASIVVIPGIFRGFDYTVMLDDLKVGLPDLRHVIVARGDERHAGTDTFDGLLAAEPNEQTQVAISANEVMLLLYTSGTTSDPKGVLHTHNTLDYENRSIIGLFGLGADDVVFMPSPVGHITGVLYGLQLPFMLGSCVVLQDKWDPGEALALIEAHRCTFTIAATPFLHGLVNHPGRTKHDLSSMRVFGCGGADVPPELVSQAERAIGCLVTRIYGSSEFPTFSGANAGDPAFKRATTDGRPIGGAEGRVVDEAGEVLMQGRTGELLVRGPDMFVGYLDATLNEAAFDADGWFHTGDFARFDEAGYVQITGRLKDIIIRGGENISAKEVEDMLFEHPSISDVAVIGMPDPVLVERNCAYIVTKGDAVPTLTELVAFLKLKKMPNQKLPERLEIVEQLPRNASGKVQKYKLRDDVRQKMMIS